MTELQARAETLIVSISGVADWRPQFVLGLQTAVVFLIGFVIFAVIVWRSIR